MMSQNQNRICSVCVALVACTLLAVALLPSAAQPAQAQLPPRPTATATPVPPSPPPPPPAPGPQGGRIELRLPFPETLSYSWQELWTVVQWQDPYTGVWHDVEGWQGTLDSVTDKVGKKTWWVARRDLGTGPFRWRVYRSQGGSLIATSEPFDLPGAAGTAVTVETSLAP